MDHDADYCAMFGRINALDYVLKTLVLAQIGQNPNASAIARESKEQTLREISACTINAKTPEESVLIHREMIGAGQPPEL